MEFLETFYKDRSTKDGAELGEIAINSVLVMLILGPLWNT